jgi:hypothetical protein
MSYQPNLFIRNIGNVSVKMIHDLISNFNFGKISKIEILNKKKEKCAVIKMAQWNTKYTECTRIMLSQGKPITLYYTEDDCWKVYAHKEEEEKRKTNDDAILKKKRENQKKEEARKLKIQKKKEEEMLKKELARIAEECRIQKEIEEEMREQWRDLNEELQAMQVDLDYGNIASYKGNTRASDRLRLLMKKLK